VNKLLALLAIVACAALGDARAAGLMCIGNDVVQFGNKLVGSYNTAHLTVSNCGAQAWSFTGVGLHPATGPAFDVDSTCTTGLTLAPGAHCTVDVIFAPLETGQTSGGYRLQKHIGNAERARDVLRARRRSARRHRHPRVRAGERAVSGAVGRDALRAAAHAAAQPRAPGRSR
jgi:hypothetical protein